MVVRARQTQQLRLTRFEQQGPWKTAQVFSNLTDHVDAVNVLH